MPLFTALAIAASIAFSVLYRERLRLRMSLHDVPGLSTDQPQLFVMMSGL